MLYCGSSSSGALKLVEGRFCRKQATSSFGCAWCDMTATPFGALVLHRNSSWSKSWFVERGNDQAGRRAGSLRAPRKRADAARITRLAALVVGFLSCGTRVFGVPGSERYYHAVRGGGGPFADDVGAGGETRANWPHSSGPTATANMQWGLTDVELKEQQRRVRGGM